MIHVFCTRGSDGARDLVLALRATGAKAKRARVHQILTSKGDLLVAWGEVFKGRLPPGRLVLNPRMIFNKWEELATLREAGVKTPPFALRKQGEGWLSRRANHQGGSDLLHPGKADYWVQRVPVTSEYRVHVLKGQVIRVGKKAHRPGWEARAHAWIRSWDAGWRLIYDFPHDGLPRGIRTASKKAVEALGLDFGAVDVGVGEGGPWVFEVNKAPGLEPKSAAAYAKKFYEISKGVIA